jgi:hypothetical protein
MYAKSVSVIILMQARRALRALRGLVRLKLLVEGNSVKRQAASTLRCMQTLARVQSQIRSRRLKMSEENQALQRQLLLKQELESLRVGTRQTISKPSVKKIIFILSKGFPVSAIEPHITKGP